MEIQGRGTHSSYYFKYSPCQQEILKDKDGHDDTRRQHHGEFHDEGEARLIHPVVSEIPKTGSGKLFKKALRDPYWHKTKDK
jgi:acyl-CoA synthetase (AMP-forming)/AMP-acid ligase II